MRRILVATDFSARSDRALRRATLLAKRAGSTLLLVHVVDDDQPARIVDAERGVARQLLAELSATISDVDGVDCDTDVILGDPFDGIVRAAADRASDLLVIGPHRRRALRDIFVGPTAERTIRAAPCPVLMANAPPVAPYRHVLLTTDLSEASRIALADFAALGIADATGSSVLTSVLHVFDAPALRLGMTRSMPKDQQAHYLEEGREAATRALDHFLTGLGAELRVAPAARLVRYDATLPANEILDAAKGGRADLIVVGTQGKIGLARLFLGSVAAEVLRTAETDVLAIPQRI